MKTLKVLGTDVQPKSSNVAINGGPTTYSMKSTGYISATNGLVMTFANISTAFNTQPPIGSYTFNISNPPSVDYNMYGVLNITFDWV
jgi:hypothetical protein